MSYFNTTTGATIYVACLASYNAGKGCGEWFDLDDFTDQEELEDKVTEMLDASPVDNAEEYRIDDSEELPSCPGTLAQAWEMHELIQEHGDVARAALSHELTVSDAASLCENIFMQAVSYEDIGAEELENYDIPACITYHVDLEGLGKDYAINFTVVEYGDTLYLFGN